MDPLKELVTILRSFLNANPHRVTLQDLAKDYRDSEGVPIPFRDYQFDNLEKFLRWTNEFNFQTIYGNTYIQAKPKAETQHIREMIAKQRKSKPKRHPAFFNKPTTLKRLPLGENRQTSSYQSNWKPGFKPPTKTTKRSENHFPLIQSKQPEMKKNEPWKPHSPPQLNRFHSSSPPKKAPENPSKRCLEQSPIKANDPWLSTSCLQAQKKTTQQSTCPRFSSSFTPVPVIQSPPRKVEQRVAKASNDPWLPTSCLQNQTKTTQQSTAASRFSSSFTPVPKIQSPPHKMEPEVSNDDPWAPKPEQSRESKDIRVKLEVNEASLEPLPEVFMLSKNTATPITDLEKYCSQMNYEEPKYTWKYLPPPLASYECRVFVLNKCYSTKVAYPTCFAAQTAVALQAIQDLSDQDFLQKYPICAVDEFLGKLQKILNDYPAGMIETAIPDYFRQYFALSPPENWQNLIRKCDDITVETVGSCSIVYTKPTFLPWSEKEWNIEITHAISTNEIYGRIISDQHSKRLQALMTVLKMAMMMKMPLQIPHDQVQEDQIYLVTKNGDWARVKVEGFDQKNQGYFCFCIDSGKMNYYTQLYHCSQDYLTLPGQAIRFSLAFLENLKEHPYAQPHLDDTLGRSQFVARILTSQKEYRNGQEPIKVILMNPDSPKMEDNINQLILQKICNETPAPQLERSTLTRNVKITHVSADGDVFCHVEDSATGLKYVQNMINALVKDETKLPPWNTVEEDSSARYLIKEPSSKNWYRATPVAPVDLKQSRKKMFCEDFGYILDIPEENIYQLEPLSQALNKFPALAIKCRMYGLSNLSQSAVSRMKKFVEKHPTCIMKVMVSSSDIPQVNWYTENDDVSFFCINESIKIQEEFDRQFQSNAAHTRTSKTG